MARKIFRSGNSLVVSLPAEALEPFGLAEGAEVSVEVDREHGGILVRPRERGVKDVDPEFAREVMAFIERYRPALEELGKHEVPHPGGTGVHPRPDH